jgi:hypothetical protein
MAWILFAAPWLLPASARRLRTLRAGVYRIVLVAAGYVERSEFVELGADGVIRAEQGAELRPVAFPWRLALAVSDAPLRVAVHPPSSRAPTVPEARFATLDRRLEAELLRALRAQGLDAFVLRPGAQPGFDPGREKGEAPPPGVVSADLQVRTLVQLVRADTPEGRGTGETGPVP